MIKQIFLKTSQLLNRDDIYKELNKITTIEECSNQSIQSDIVRMINYYNFVINTIFENYISLETTEEVLTNENGEVFYSSFSQTPNKIITVLNSSNQKCSHKILINKILTDLSNQKIKVVYNYVPSEINDLNQGINYPSVLNDKIVCYGIASEFLASKDQFDKSEFWKNKFLFELFKFKTKKERRLKKLYYV